MLSEISFKDFQHPNGIVFAFIGQDLVSFILSMVSVFDLRFDSFYFLRLESENYSR